MNPTALDSAEQGVFPCSETTGYASLSSCVVENRYQQHKLEKEDHTLTELGSYKNYVDSWPDYSDDEEFVSEFDQMRVCDQSVIIDDHHRFIVGFNVIGGTGNSRT